MESSDISSCPLSLKKKYSAMLCGYHRRLAAAAARLPAGEAFFELLPDAAADSYSFAFSLSILIFFSTKIPFSMKV